MKVLLPDSVELDVRLPEGVQGITYAITDPVPDQHTDAEVLVTWGNPDHQLRDAARRLTKLRWIQSLAAGPDTILRAGFAPEVLVTAGGGLHDRTVAEHTLALVLGAARRLNLLVRAQIGRRWAREWGGLQPLWEADNFRTLRDAHVVIWGFGGIAATLAPHLAALGARVTGVARSAGERHGFPVRTVDDFPDLLPTADVLILILPATAETEHALDAAVLGLLPRHAWVVNVGRGTTVAESDLLAAVREGRIAGAALDVFETEPLPADSGLWDEPNVIISPHAAGGRPLGAPALIRENLDALLAGRPLKHLVER
ncbi:phosphoglycerate dehydrogenase [Paractinoplanes rishiriensis]|uniref:Phosphoglycerate dehydrogenase n=1 Tax=Paractinoplanes rishiriensis TaxID=1050105 RepID=A0A919MTH4_9ACTN|nr:phosphoglycerate dehydrogenase [Actinoplanes rishiriensis]GIE99261.1 phosphoglycerate dehydrogenase [Actinoplanes rishiriensis]